MKAIHSLVAPYFVAFLAVAIALLLTLLLQPLLAPTIFLLFFAAVVVSIWYGGVKSGLLAAVLSTVVVSYFFIEPTFSLQVKQTDGLIRLGIFLLITTIISLLNLELQRSKERLEKIVQQLAASEAKFRRLTDANIIGVIIADIQGTIIEANDAFLEMVGYTREDLLTGRVTWQDITTPEYQEIYHQTMRQVQTQGVCQPFEKECICKDGSYINILLGFALLENNQEQVIGFVLDLTERKQAEIALQESQSRFFALANATVEGVIIHENYWVLDANPAFAKISGYELSEIIGRSLLDFFNLESQEILQANFSLDDEQPYEVSGLRKDHTCIYLEVIEKNCLYQGKNARVLAVRNITRRKQAEQALKYSERRFRRLVESNILGVAFGGFDGGIHYANDYFLNMVGYSREEMLSGVMRWDLMTPPEYKELDHQVVQDVLKNGVVNPYEKEYIHKNGSLIPVLMGVALLQETDDNQQEMIAFCLDLSKQKAALRDRQLAATALRQREEELRLITNAVPVLISYVDTQQRYRFNNQRYAEWFGVPIAEIYGKHLQELLDESNYQSILPYVETVLSGEQVQFESKLPHQDGTIRDVKISYVPQFNQQQEVEGFVSLIQDITEQKQSAVNLQASEERFRQLTEKVRVIPWQLDKITHTFTYVGPQSEEILGYPVNEWYQSNFWVEHIHPEDREKTLKLSQESAQVLDNFEFEYRMIAADGRIVWLYEIVNVVRGEQEPKLLHGFMIDISDRKQAEQEREQLLEREKAARTEAESLNRIKDEFLATLSHELRTPLNAILGWTQLLKNRKFNEATTKMAMETIDRNSHTLAQLIEDVLDVSRIIRGKLGLNTQPVDLHAIIQAAINTVCPAADAKEIEIVAKLDPSIGLVVGDASRLQQIFWNLLSNAVKFTTKGGKVEIELERINSRVQIRVSDNGGGIAPEFLPHVFERFRQADSSTTRSHGGLGLGLAIVRHLVELHGGTVEAESAGIGQGATFTVNLPMKAVAVESITLKRPSVYGEVYGSQLQMLAELRVLVVDDEVDARYLVSTILEQYGAQVLAVASVAEAMTALAEFHPNVIVSDIGMPEEDGYALIRKVRSLAPEAGGKIPAVALTAYARSEDRTQALLAGYQLHIPKPVSPIELAVVVANLAGRT
ncbi:MAG TPA: PAS domain S-box protein [Nostocaceae cyanobacterium]|nr:PAS domain S-box protein [Nostocaceae cyanobacterium]